MKSIIQQSSCCYFCGATQSLEEHHIFFGNPGRKISERNGFKVKLCPYCHRKGPKAPHRDRNSDLMLKRIAQRKYEESHTREEFIELIGRNYL